MHIDRNRNQGGIDVAIQRVSFCLDQLEKAKRFEGKIDLDTEIVQRLSVEEMIGALVSAEQELVITKQLVESESD